MCIIALVHACSGANLDNERGKLGKTFKSLSLGFDSGFFLTLSSLLTPLTCIYYIQKAPLMKWRDFYFR